MRRNVISDLYYGITNITYDQRNLPLSMTTSTNTTYKYRYDDGGNRIFKDAQGKKEYYFRDDKGHEVAVYDITTDRPKMINLYGSDLLGRIDLSWTSQYDYEMEEYYWVRTDQRNYYVKDHLGSIRQTLNQSGTVMSAMDYYAFGGTLSSYVNGNTIDKYKFTGKERDSETGLDYFGARYYDSKICRWMSVDPLADKYPGLSPYNYCVNNPLQLVDPNGMWPFYYHDLLIRDAFQQSLNGNTVRRLIDASYWADNGSKSVKQSDGTMKNVSFQEADFSYIHAMKNTGSGDISDDEALRQIDNWLMQKQSDDPVFDLGLKLHTIMDLTCNIHYLRSWNGNILTNYFVNGHFTGELVMETAEFRATTKLMKDFYTDYKAGKIKHAKQYRANYDRYYSDEARWTEFDPQYK